MFCKCGITIEVELHICPMHLLYLATPKLEILQEAGGNCNKVLPGALWILVMCGLWEDHIERITILACCLKEIGIATSILNRDGFVGRSLICGISDDPEVVRIWRESAYLCTIRNYGSHHILNIWGKENHIGISKLNMELYYEIKFVSF